MTVDDYDGANVGDILQHFSAFGSDEIMAGNQVT